ncbi:MAG: hypothetical protein RQ862_10725 [Candidatus Caldarchaeales archaeon]|nr:hypothetical protein [Candidatus Caldarchaeales archaeon]
MRERLVSDHPTGIRDRGGVMKQKLNWSQNSVYVLIQGSASAAFLS